MVAEGRETGGGMAKGTMSSRLRSLADGQTEVVAEASVDITGRIMQVGRGMIAGVAHQLFQQFAARMKERLETAQAATVQGATGSPPPAVTEPDAIRVLPLVLNVFWSAIAGFFRRLFGRSMEPK